MKRSLLVLTVGWACLGAAHSQQAKSPLYGEVRHTAATVTDSGYRFNPGRVRAIVGYGLHPNLAVEGMVGLGLSDRSVSVPAGNVDLAASAKVRHAYGMSLRPKFSVNEKLEVFGRLGYLESKFRLTLDAQATGASESDRQVDLFYGVGARYNLSGSQFISVDFMNHYVKDGTRANGVTAGIGLRF